MREERIPIDRIKGHVLGDDFMKLVDEVSSILDKRFGNKFIQYILGQPATESEIPDALAVQNALDLHEDALAIIYCILNPERRNYLPIYIRLAREKVARIASLLKL